MTLRATFATPGSRHYRFRGLVLTLMMIAMGAMATRAAFAQSPSSEAMFERRRSEAKAQFEEGAELYQEGRYTDAVGAFLAAEALSPSPALSFNIARAYERLGDASSSLRWYRDYLRRSARATDRDLVVERVALLDAQLTHRGLQQVTFLSSPAGATVALDGAVAGPTPYTADLKLGEHRVVLNAPGYRERAFDLVLGADAPEDSYTALQRVTSADPSSARKSPAGRTTRAVSKPEPGTHFGITPYVVAGAGVALLGAAFGFELERRAQEAKAAAAPTQIAFRDEIGRMDASRTAARVLLGVGSVALASGVVLFLFNPRGEKPTPVAFGCGPRGCAVTVQGVL